MAGSLELVQAMQVSPQVRGCVGVREWEGRKGMRGGMICIYERASLLPIYFTSSSHLYPLHTNTTHTSHHSRSWPLTGTPSGRGCVR